MYFFIYLYLIFQTELEKTGVEYQMKMAQCEKSFQESVKQICEEAEKKSKENIRSVRFLEPAD